MGSKAQKDTEDDFTTGRKNNRAGFQPVAGNQLGCSHFGLLSSVSF
jgi:hypothetical protein